MSRCFILGAGFSRTCGLPLARELTQLVFDKAYGTADGFGAELRNAYLEFIRHLYPTLDCSSHGLWPEFEDLITVLDEWADWQRCYEGHDRSEEVPTAGHLKQVLLKELECLVCDYTSRVSPESMALVEKFVRQRLDCGDHLISFNWDTLIEIAAENLGINVNYGIDGDGLRVSKPHGSLNLAEMTHDEYEKSCRSLNVHSLDVEWRDDERLVIRAHDPTDTMHRVVAPFERTTLIQPSARKSYQSSWINNQWKSAYRAIREASDVFVIGFSLPPTDYRPRLLFQNATIQRETLPILHLVDPAANDLLSRYRDVVAIEIEAIAKPWPEWMDEFD